MANLLGLKDLVQQIVGDTKLLIAGIEMKKSQFTCFLDLEDVSIQSRLLQKLDLWQSSTPIYPAICKTQELALSNILTTLIGEAAKVKSMPFECSGLEIPSKKIFKNIEISNVLQENDLCGNRLS